MANTRFQHKRSSVSGVVPTTSDIATGELGINLADRRLFTSNGTTVFELGSNLTNLSVSANLTIGTSGDLVFTNGAGIFANGSIGGAGQVLHSNGVGVYWADDDQGVTSVATGVGLTGGTITTTGTVSVLANNGITANTTGLFVTQGTGAVVNSTGVHVNTAFIGTLTANNANNLNGQPASFYTNATNITTGTLPNARLAAEVVNTSGAFTITGIYTYSANVVMGNTTVNTQLSNTTILISNSTSTTTLGLADLRIGNTATNVVIANTVSTFGGNVVVTGTANVRGPLIQRSSAGQGLIETIPASGTFVSELRLHTNDTGTFQRVRNNSGALEVGTTDSNPLRLLSNGTVRATFSGVTGETDFSTATNIGSTLANTRISNSTITVSNATSTTTITPGDIRIGNTTTNVVIANTTSSFGGNVSITGSANAANVTAAVFTGNLTGTASNATNLNSQPGSFYTNATNITTGTLDNARLPSTINVTSVNAATLSIGNSTQQQLVNSTGAFVNGSLNLTRNDQRLTFTPTAGGANVYLVQQSDDNFVLYTTNTSGNPRAVFSVFGNTNPSNQNSAFTFRGPVDFSSAGVYANNSLGSAGQVLTSNGTGVYWSTVASSGGTVTNIATGSGLTGGPITTTGTVSVLANNGITANSTGLFVTQGTGTVVNATGVHVNSTFIGTLTANNSTNLDGQPASFYTNATNITTGTLPDARLSSAIVNTTGTFTMTGIRTHQSNLVVGNTTVNTQHSNATILISNSTSTTTISLADIRVGNTASNVIISNTVSSFPANLHVGNTTVNTQHSSATILISNSTSTTTLGLADLRIGNTTSNVIIANTVSSFPANLHVGSTTVNTRISGTSLILANATSTTTLGLADLRIGNTATNVVIANTTSSFGGNVSVSNTLSVANIQLGTTVARGRLHSNSDFTPSFGLNWAQTASFTASGNNGGGIALLQTATGYGMWLENSGQSLVFGGGNTSTNLTRTVIFAANGSVGIGDVASIGGGAQLDVSRDSGGSRFRVTVSSTNTLLTHVLSDGVTLTNSIHNAQTHIWQTGSTERARIDSSGNVGIGNTAPDARLAVTGTANVSGNVVIGGTAAVSGNLTVASTSELIISNGAGIQANGTFGTAGQVLSSNSTGVYWATPAGGLSGGELFNINVTNATGYAVNTTMAAAFTAPSTAGIEYVVHSIQITNIGTANAAISGELSGTTYSNISFALTVPVPRESAVELLKMPKVLQPSDIIRLQADVNSTLHAYITIESITSTAYFGSGVDITADATFTDLHTATGNSVITSVLLSNDDGVNDVKARVVWTDGANTIQGYLCFDMIIPADSTVELLEKVKFLPSGHKIRVYANVGGRLEAIIAGKLL